MKVTLLNYTSDALELLLRTKNTRLKHDSDPASWTEAQKAEHLSYMRDTIKSSWEFVDYVFLIEGVTRAFTHQLVRTRTGSYAQEAMRVIDASEHVVSKPLAIFRDAAMDQHWDSAVGEMMGTYKFLLDMGAAAQDARGLLPTNVTTSINAKFNLRTLHNMGELRLCTRTQGEYQDVFREMRRLVIEVHPWAAEFINVYCANHGTCAFPRYGRKECPIYKYVIPVELLKEYRTAVDKAFWDGERYEAAPVAKEGRAM